MVNYVENVEKENGILFNVVKSHVNSYDVYEARDFVKPGFCKVVLIIDNGIVKTHYFKDGVETSKEKILHDERIKSFRR